MPFISRYRLSYSTPFGFGRLVSGSTLQCTRGEMASSRCSRAEHARQAHAAPRCTERLTHRTPPTNCGIFSTASMTHLEYRSHSHRYRPGTPMSGTVLGQGKKKKREEEKEKEQKKGI